MGVDCPVGSLLPWRSAMTGRNVRILASSIRASGRARCGAKRRAIASQRIGARAAGDACPVPRRQTVANASDKRIDTPSLATRCPTSPIPHGRQPAGPSSKRRSWWRPCRSRHDVRFALCANGRAGRPNAGAKRRWRIPRAADNARAVTRRAGCRDRALRPLPGAPYRSPSAAWRRATKRRLSAADGCQLGRSVVWSVGCGVTLRTLTASGVSNRCQVLLGTTTS